MNLVEALDAALPEIPRERLSRSRPPQLDPDLVTHETVLDGEPVIGVLQRGKNNYYRFSPAQWELAGLFDGQRSYEDVADLYSVKTGTPLAQKKFGGLPSSWILLASSMRRTRKRTWPCATNCWLNAAGAQNQRSTSHTSVFPPGIRIDISAGLMGWLVILFTAAGAWLTALLLFAFESVVVVNNWHSMGPDTALFFNFAQKSLAEFARFWFLILIVGFLHESAHGLTCKHYGGQVHSMGLMFLYLVPCFFVDVTESWVSGTKVQRLATIIAGIWIELVVCAIAMMFWLQTPAGGWFHSSMYEFILLTGFAAVVINLNPLIKLDGYYLLTEIIEIPDLKGTIHGIPVDLGAG